MKTKIYLLPLITLLLTGCSSGKVTVSTQNQDETDAPIDDNSGEVTPTFNTGDDDYKDFFNHANDVEVKVKISNEVAYKTNDYGKNGSWSRQEMYHPCDVTININGTQRFFAEETGIRLKGNLSKENDPAFVDSNGHLQYKSHFKIHFAKTFDSSEDNDYYTHNWSSASDKKARSKRKFGGMKKLDFKWNRNNDETFTREAYAKYCYRDAGVVAQNINLVKFTIETDSDSQTFIYQAFETVDGQSLDRYYTKDGGAGNLYKGLYAQANLTTSSISGKNLDPESESNQYPVYPLKTNEKNPDHTLFRNIVSLLNGNSNAASFKKSFEQVAEVDNIIRYLAVSWVVGNPDDLKNNANNTYFYFNSINDHFSIIPYDDDRAFGITDGWAVDMSSLPADSTRMQGKSYNSGSKVWVDNPLIWRLSVSENDSNVNYSDKWPVVQEYQNLYMQYVQEFANKYLDEDKFIQFTNEFANAPSKDTSLGGGSNQTFAYYASNKKAHINK